MRSLSVLTLVKDREEHLIQLVEGLARSTIAPAELIIVDMSERPVILTRPPCPTRIIRLETKGLPLAGARNLAAAAAVSDGLVFLDVDCIPMAACLDRLSEELGRSDALLCADIRYLGPGDARPGWTEADLLRRGVDHPVRSFPSAGVRAETDAGLFWSLAFAMRRTRFASLGGFDEEFTGYGGEDTDFGFRSAAAGVPLLFVGGAIACHQHHGGHQPPVQHLDDILHNARIFRRRWQVWPMSGWLETFEAMGLIAWRDGEPIRTRATCADDLDRTRTQAAI